jgi:hypothetical protein
VKRSRSGSVIHRDDCPRGRQALPWAWADGMSDEELFLRMVAYPWLRLCRGCFDDDALSLAKAALTAGAWP